MTGSMNKPCRIIVGAPVPGVRAAAGQPLRVPEVQQGQRAGPVLYAAQGPVHCPPGWMSLLSSFEILPHGGEIVRRPVWRIRPTSAIRHTKSERTENDIGN